MSIWTDDSVKNLRFLANGTDITEKVKVGSFSCEDILCDEQLAFGSCNSARAQFVTIEDLSLTGAQVVVQYGNGSEWANLGTYKVTYSAQQINSNEVNLTMYDVVKEFDVDIADWYVGRAFPMTLKAFRDALVAFIGVQQTDVDLANDSMTVYETIAPSKLNGMDMLRYIGEINGVFPHANADGQLDWVSLGAVPKQITASVIQGAGGVAQKSYETSPIGKLKIRTEDGDVGVSVGSGANTYFVTANVLCYGLSTEQLTPIATNLFNKIYGIQYTPTSLSMKCDPTIMMGDQLEYYGKYFFVLNRKTSGLLFDTITAGGNEYLKEDDSVESNIEQLRGKSNVLTHTIEETSDRITNIEDDYTTHTEFQQTADSINFELQQIQSQLDGDIELIYTEEAPTKLNYPYWDWTGMYANDGEDIPAEERQFDPAKVVYYANDDLFFLYLPTELQKHVRTMVFDQANLMTYRFVKIDGQFVWQELADTETSVILSRLTQVEAKADGVQSSVEQISIELDENFWTRAETQTAINQKADSITTEVATTYATKTETQSLSTRINQTNSSISTEVQRATTAEGNLATRISQTDSSISAEVRRATSSEAAISGKVDLKIDKTDNNQVVSMLNASANIITLNSNRLVVNSDNFKLDKNGHVTCSGADIGGKLLTTGSGVFDFTYTDLNTLRNYVTGQGSLTQAQRIAYDFNCDGTVDLMDFALLKNYLIRGTKAGISNKYVWNSYPISVLVDASNPAQAIKITGKDNVGIEHTYTFGSGGLNVPIATASVVRADSVAISGTELGLVDVNIGGTNYKVLGIKA